LEKQKRQVEQKTREWQRPRAGTPAQQRTKEEARSRRAVVSSFAKSTKTNEQTKVRVVVPAEVPHDTRICIEDLVNTDVDESDVDEQKSNANSRQKSELSEADFERDELHSALKSALETSPHVL